MRAFIAIELPLDIKNALVKIQDKLKTTLPKISWVKPANLHLSLKFLGEISLKQLKETQQIIAEIIKTSSPFEIKLETLGVFPNCRAARIIWIGTNQPPRQLKQLVDQLETKLLKIGLPEEQHPFRAHITLSRIKNPLIPSDLERGLDKVKNDCSDANLKFNTRGITLFQSVLGPGGPTYSILKEAAF
ncbi:MAG: RNA 2',3'-cyclic phosphodiesterase [Candidatus Omnitrophota bacterium]|nr:RNA 2',3'-cyclic phosphodiesterase [Candidatus Omnitrophota bacterium]